MAGNPFVLPKLGYFSWDEILRSYLLSSKCNNYQSPNKNWSELFIMLSFHLKNHGG